MVIGISNNIKYQSIIILTYFEMITLRLVSPIGNSKSLANAISRDRMINFSSLVFSNFLGPASILKCGSHKRQSIWYPYKLKNLQFSINFSDTIINGIIVDMLQQPLLMVQRSMGMISMLKNVRNDTKRKRPNAKRNPEGTDLPCWKVPYP